MHDLDLDVPRFNGRTPLLVLLSLRRHRGLARRGGALGVADHLRVAQRARFASNPLDALQMRERVVGGVVGWGGVGWGGEMHGINR